MDYDRLRELQAKFDENPRRYFAPLANEYRKGGNPKRAIEICRAHLAQMPGHMSGQVVYGQSLFEGGEYDEARKVFEGALLLDPENLIALRSLGDLSLQAGDTAQARSWYTRLLEADPKDAAVIALIAVIDSSPPAAPAAEPEITSELTVDFSFVDSPPESPGQESATEEAPVTAASEATESGHESTEPESQPPLGLEHHYPTGESAPGRTEPMGADPDALDWSTAAAPSSALSEPGAETEASAETDSSDSSEQVSTTGEYEYAPPQAEQSPDADTGAATAPTGPVEAQQPSAFGGANPEPFVNETMAQLYLQQGYRQLALRVYRQLAERRPNEQALRDRIAEIEAMQASDPDNIQARRSDPPSIESPTPQPDAPRSPSTESPLPHGPGVQPSSVEGPAGDSFPVDSPPSGPSSEPDSIESPDRHEPRAEPEGIAARQPSIREFFATLGRRRPPPVKANGPDSWGRRDAPALVPQDSLKPTSLDAVFAGAKVSSTDARAASTLAGAFSASARTTSPPSAASTPTPRANPRLQTQESEEDVAKFRAWLDGLTGE